MSTKVIKDPIYGYIDIERIEVESIIDTACFQRLRNITQTSYSALYPSSVHNRFCHSLGVFHLGCLAFDSFKTNALNLTKSISEQTWKEWENTFLLACLLHDIAHTPFSHLTEDFYDINNEGISELNKLLDNKTTGFNNDGKFQGKAHEKMSAIVGSEILDMVSIKYDKNLFIRCIIGEKFKDRKNVENGIKNCLIELLNSKTIDVDKLDYLIRDRVMTGHESTEIDFIRLLKHVTMVCIDKKAHQEIYKHDDNNIKNFTENYYAPAFLKGGLSVLENVILARDTEKRWFQSHPTICYDSYILQHVFQQVNDFCENELTRIDALTEKGISVNKLGHNIKLLTDGDILFLAKNRLNKEQFEQFFCRGSRLRAIWKSASEYYYLFEEGTYNKTLLKHFGQFIEILAQKTNRFSLEIGNKLLKELKAERRTLSKEIAKEECSKLYTQSLNTLDLQISFVECLRRFDSENFRYVFLSTNQFNTGFNEENFNEILIYFAKDNKIKMIKNVANTPSRNTPLEKMFYILVSLEHRNQLNENNKKYELIGTINNWITVNKEKLNEEFNSHIMKSKN